MISTRDVLLILVMFMIDFIGMLDAMAEAPAEAMADRVLWRTPDPVWTQGRGQGPTAGSALD